MLDFGTPNKRKESRRPQLDPGPGSSVEIPAVPILNVIHLPRRGAPS